MDETTLLEEVLNGKERVWRFTEQEQSGSSESSDRLLWLAILRAESEFSSAFFGGDPSGADSASDGAPSPSRFLTTLSLPLPSSFNELISELGQYEDRGRESIVCNSGDGFVCKVRPMIPSPCTGYLAPLANIVYHNRLFPSERYTLENIYASGSRYYLVLRQERVEIRLDEQGYPVKPTRDQIREAIDGLALGLVEFTDDADGSDSSTGTGDFVGGGLKFFNADYVISDLQPGRNTVIDDANGRVRFIDPRITLNDPEGPLTPVSHYGKRREWYPGQRFA